MISRNSAPWRPIESRKMSMGAPWGIPLRMAAASDAYLPGWMAWVTPISRIQPAISETTMDMTMPRGPATSAPTVSSVMCAEAS